MRRLILMLACCAGLGQMAKATTLEFDIYGTYANGDEMIGRMSYSLSPLRRSGNDHLYAPGTQELSFRVRPGFWINLSNIVTGFGTGSDGVDYFYAQSFQSEGANEWHISLDLRGIGILGGVQELPRTFPTRFDYSYILAYKTDEGNWLRNFEAKIDYILPKGTLPPPAPIPVPPSAALLGFAILGTFAWRRKRDKATRRDA